VTIWSDRRVLGVKVRACTCTWGKRARVHVHMKVKVRARTCTWGQKCARACVHGGKSARAHVYTGVKVRARTCTQGWAVIKKGSEPKQKVKQGLQVRSRIPSVERAGPSHARIIIYLLIYC
jgi:hypothetical protein